MSELRATISHKEMYKTRTPPWKEVYRRRCLSRLRESRQKQYSHRRSVEVEGQNTCEEEVTADISEDTAGSLDIQGIMRDEWQRLQQDKGKGQGMGLEEEWSELPDASMDQMVSLLDDIHKEMRQEELRLLQTQEACDQYWQKEEEELCHALGSLDTSQVVCPLCQRHALSQVNGVILCPCGLRVDTEQDGIHLQDIHRNLQDGLREHEEQCDTKASFSMAEAYGCTSLIMSCKVCDFLCVII